MIDRTKITSCRNSNIQEAWCGIFGSPYVFNKGEEDDFGAQIGSVLKKAFPEISQQPALILIPSAPVVTSPIWTRQFSWLSGKQVARTGRRYLSVHRICDPPIDRYTTFEQEIATPAKNWLDGFDSILAPGEFKASVVSAGYLNKFNFESDKFNLKDYFNLTLTFQAAGDPGEIVLSGLNTTFTFGIPSKQHQIELTLHLSQPDSEKRNLILTTNVSCKRGLSDGICLTNSDSLWAEIAEARREAKLQFYSFCTDKTLKEILDAI